MDLDADGVRRARVWAQLLDGATPMRSPVRVAGRLVGIQAQDITAAALAVRARTTEATAATVISAIRSGDLVLTWTLRGTRHLHRRDDLPWLLGLFGPMYAGPTKRDADLGIAGATGERAVATLRDALASDGPLTRADVKQRLAPLGVDPTGQAAIHVIRRAALRGLLTVVPDEDGKERYAALDAEPDGTTPEQAITELARRYLRAFAPATPADFAAWSGVGRRAADRAWHELGSRLTEAATPTGPQWIPTSYRTHARAATDRRAPLRLLGGFDSLLLAYVDRSLHVAPEHARKVNAGGGLVKPVVVDDGRVVGTWTRHRVDAFPGHQVDAGDQLEDVRRFLG